MITRTLGRRPGVLASPPVPMAGLSSRVSRDTGSHLLYLAARSPWWQAVECDQRDDRSPASISMPDGSVAVVAGPDGEQTGDSLEAAMSRAAGAMWARR